MASPFRIAVLNYTGDRANWGCQATSHELLALLRRICAPREVEFVLVPLLSPRRIDRILAALAGPLLAQALQAEPASGFQKLLVWIVAWIRYWKYFADLRSCDCVIYQGEGTMTGTNFVSGVRLLVLPYVAQELMHKPLLSLNQTVFSASAEFEAVIKRCFVKHDLAAVREPASQLYLKRLGVGNVALIPDTAFNAQPAGQDAELQIEPPVAAPYFCVSGSASLAAGDFDSLLNLVQAVEREHGLTPVYLCSAHGDVAFLNYVRDTFGPDRTIHAVPIAASYQEVAAVLAGGELLVTGRYHMAILAACVGTPLVLLPTNTFKNHGLVELLRYPLPVRGFTATGDLLKDVRYVLARRGELSRQLGASLATIRGEIARGEVLLRDRLAPWLEPNVQPTQRAKSRAA